MNAATTETDWDDRELGRAIGVGFVIGIPTMFLLALLIVLLGHVAGATAAGVALVPAIFIGPYIGGLLLMSRASARHEHPVEQHPTAT